MNQKSQFLLTFVKKNNVTVPSAWVHLYLHSVLTLFRHKSNTNAPQIYIANFQAVQYRLHKDQCSILNDHAEKSPLKTCFHTTLRHYMSVVYLVMNHISLQNVIISWCFYFTHIDNTNTVNWKSNA